MTPALTSASWADQRHRRKRRCVRSFRLAGKVVGVAADANDPTAVDAAHREAERLIGPIDILIITAGVVGPSAPVWAYDLNTFNEIIAVNFMGTVHWLRAALPRCAPDVTDRLLPLRQWPAKRETLNSLLIAPRRLR